MLKYAITGNIASGKSQVEKILLEKGYPVYDSDKFAHEILNTITDFYGYEVFTDGKIDRKKLGRLVFENSEIKQQLEALVHPKVKEKILEMFEKHSTDKVVFISVPLLFEADFTDLFDKILFISCPDKIRLERLMSRNSLSENEAKQRIEAQIPEELKIKHCDYVIKNDSNLENLKLEIETFCHQI